jgi:hypothetical protein
MGTVNRARLPANALKIAVAITRRSAAMAIVRWVRASPPAPRTAVVATAVTGSVRPLKPPPPVRPTVLPAVNVVMVYVKAQRAKSPVPKIVSNRSAGTESAASGKSVRIVRKTVTSASTSMVMASRTVPVAPDSELPLADWDFCYSDCWLL